MHLGRLADHSNDFADSQERLTFLSSVANKVNNPNSQDAYVYATVAVATVKLELEDFDGARKDLDKAEKILDNFDSVETIVHAAFSLPSRSNHRADPIKDEHRFSYRSGLRYRQLA